MTFLKLDKILKKGYNITNNKKGGRDNDKKRAMGQNGRHRMGHFR